MKKASLGRFLVIYFINCIVCNMVHPVTPTLFKQLNFPSYMFGVAFAAMAVGNFLFSPFWGTMGGKIGYIKTFSIGMVGYGLGQIAFMISGNIWVTIVARFVTGAFAAACNIGAMAYVARLADDRNRAKYMAMNTAVSSVGTAMGFFVGGMIGVYSIQLSFLAQIIGSFIVAGLMLAFVKENAPMDGKKFSLKMANPISAFAAIGKVMTVPLAMFLFCAALSNFGSTAFDNSFNYYITDQFAFPTSYNGIIKAAVGIIGLLANFTINMVIAARCDGRKAIVPVLFMCGGTLVLIPLISEIPLFVVAAVVFFTFNAIYLPIQQTLVTRCGGDSGVMFGAFNALRSAGMIFGALVAGFVYGVDAKLPFYIAGAAFVVAAGLYAVNYYQYKKVNM